MMADRGDFLADFQSAKEKVDMYLQTMKKITYRGVQLGEIMDEDETSGGNVGELLDSLEMLAQQRSFCCGGWIELNEGDAKARLKMREDVKNQCGWPLTKLPVDGLLEFCRPASYGDLKLQQTVYNPEVRLASECEASKFLFTQKPQEPKTGAKRKRSQAPSSMGSGNYQPVFLNAIRKRVSSTLAYGKDVALECYKLNVYGKGGFFSAHVDTPVDPAGMIGTVVVCLPCQHTGGVLTVKHQGVKEEFPFADLSADQGKIQWAAFYSDCIHEILPVEDGNRITITYNIIRKNTGYSGSAGSWSCKNESFSSGPKVAADTKPVLDGIISGIIEIAADEHLEKFGIFLQHRYTMSALAAGNLKGCDQVLYDGISSRGLTCNLLTVLVDEVEMKADDYGETGCEDEERKDVYACSQEDMEYVNNRGPKPKHASWKKIRFLQDWSKEELVIEEEETESENCGNWTEPGEIKRLYLQSTLIVDIPGRSDAAEAGGHGSKEPAKTLDD